MSENNDSNGSWTLKTSLPVEFTVKNSPGIFSPDNLDLLSHGTVDPGRRLIAIDKNICPHYLKDATHYFENQKVEYRIVPLNVSEENKNLDCLLTLLREMETFGIVRRNEPIIAIGGGVLLDVVGMAASLYRRGVPYIKVPTTVVALVDASVGAKTAINFENRRNRLGTYYPPVAAYLDKTFLKTLENIEVSSGLGEILKMAVVKDSHLFHLLEQYGTELYQSKFMDCECADEVINRSTKGMIEELEPNLWEKNLMRLVDFGHSFSPIIEMRSISEPGHSPLTHGQAVALDVLFSCVLSHLRKMLSMNDLERVFETTKSMGLPVYHELFTQPLSLKESLEDTMRHRNGAQNLPIPKTIGDSLFLNDISYRDIKNAASLFAEISQSFSTKVKAS